MKVLHLISSGGYYGAESMLLNLIAAQRRAGVDATLLAFDNLGQSHLEVVTQAIQRGLPAETIRCRGRFDRTVTRSIAQTVRDRGISILHSHGYKSNFYACLAARRAGVRFVSTCHLWTRASIAVRLFEMLDAYILRRAHRVAGVSEEIVSALHNAGIPATRTALVLNGIDTAIQAQAEPSLRSELAVQGGPLVGTVARLEEQKGLTYYIEAAFRVLVDCPTATFIIVGEGSLRPHLTQLIRSYGLERKVLLLGERTNMREVYASIDLFVLASIDEGLPMVLLEALRESLPIVATRVGAVPRLIHDRETGLLVEPGDAAGLGHAILNCLREPSRAREFGRKGHALVCSQFSADAMAESYLEIYRQVAMKADSTRNASLAEV